MSASIDETLVRRVAQLARLRLSADEVAAMTIQLGAIIAYVDQLGEVNTDGVEPLLHPLPLHDVMREDVPHQPLGAEAALANAPNRHDDFFKVPAVLDGASGA